MKIQEYIAESICKGPNVYHNGPSLVLLADHLAALEAQRVEYEGKIADLVQADRQDFVEMMAANRKEVAEKDAEIAGFKEDIFDTHKQIIGLRKEVAELRGQLKMLLDFIPDGWSMPLGYSQLVAQIKEATDGCG